MFKIKRCDNCGKINPPPFNENNRLCGACAEIGGFYQTDRNSRIGANGKINYWNLQFPFKIIWKGWWTLK